MQANMKLNLALPGTKREYRLLFSNAGEYSPNNFYLLMVFHKSKKGGFGKTASTSECEQALRRKNKRFRFLNKFKTQEVAQ